MVKISFISFDQKLFPVEAEEGSTLMESAILNDVPGIDGDCGGACACATCHVYIDTPWLELLKKPDEIEEHMLDFACDWQKNSRLSCQIRIKKNLEGLVVFIPERQG